jgi:hypothetical protein
MIAVEIQKRLLEAGFKTKVSHRDLARATGKA